MCIPSNICPKRHLFLMSTKKKGFNGQISLESPVCYSFFWRFYLSFNSSENFLTNKLILFCLTQCFPNLFDYGIYLSHYHQLNPTKIPICRMYSGTSLGKWTELLINGIQTMFIE